MGIEIKFDYLGRFEEYKVEFKSGVKECLKEAPKHFQEGYSDYDFLLTDLIAYLQGINNRKYCPITMRFGSGFPYSKKNLTKDIVDLLNNQKVNIQKKERKKA